MITRSFLCKQSVALQTILLPRLAPHLLEHKRVGSLQAECGDAIRCALDRWRDGIFFLYL